jgi:hypothetical protein
LAYVVYQRGQIGGIQYSRLIRLFETRQKKNKSKGDEVGLSYIYRRIAYQSTHCGKVDWKVSVQVHLITLMNAPGLKMTFDIDQ